MKLSSQGRVLSIEPKVETDPRKGWKWNIFHFFFVKRTVNKIEKKWILCCSEIEFLGWVKVGNTADLFTSYIFAQYLCYSKNSGKITIQLVHLVGRVRNSDWIENSFIMIVYEKFSQNFLSKARIKIIFIDSHYKTIVKSVRSACSSCAVW